MDTSLLKFNQSVFEANQLHRWGFLEDMRTGESQQIGFLLQSPRYVIGLTLSYIVFVCFVGPLWMRSRAPFELKGLIRLYNLVMVLLAGMLLIRLLDAIEFPSYLFDCSKTFAFDDQSASKVHLMGSFILTVRLSEYLDTVFFTLRKKYNQVTFLHVFHHAFVPIYAYWILRTAPTRFNVYIIVINSFIHVLMYSYYLLATYQQPTDPKVRPSFGQKMIREALRFKKYMTQLQILQFVSLFFYSLYPLSRKNMCNVPTTYVLANFFLASGFLALFLHFYIRSYKGAAAAAANRQQQKSASNNKRD